MAISDRFRVVYKDDDIEYVFSPRAFKHQIDECYAEARRRGIKKTKEQIKDEIAEKTSRSVESVRQWSRGFNGPGDIDIIKDIAQYFGIDFKDLLVCAGAIGTEQLTEIKASGNDEKSVVVQIHALLTEFIYNYVGNDDGDCYLQRTSESGVVSFDDMNNYIFDVYRILEQAALNLSDDTYKKLHQLITECRTLLFHGTSTSPYLSVWLSSKPTWVAANPKLELVAKYAQVADFCEVQEIFDKEEMDLLYEEFRLESGVVPCYRIVDGQKIYAPEDFWFYDSCEIVSMELARTLSILFKNAFRDLFQQKF